MEYFEPLKEYRGQSRAFLKVQDGCDGYCSYCIIPSIRKNVCSRDKKSVVEEAQMLVEAGHSEIVLTGIFLGAYGLDTVRRKRWQGGNSRLGELVGEVAQVNGLKRLRLSSLEPGDVTESLLSVVGEHDNVARHFHLPLQSGSERILKRMGRQYGVSDYKEMIYRIKERFDRPAITTDIIVGFPGESDEDFAQSVDMARFAGFSKIHVFSFSARKGTAAAGFEPKIGADIIKCRSGEMMMLSDELTRVYRENFVGEPVEVIIEDSDRATGRCGQYFEVKVNGLDGEVNKNDMIVAVLNKDTVSGEFVKKV